MEFENNKRSVKEEIVIAFSEIGANPRLSGYETAMMAVEFVVEDRSKIHNMMKLYEEIAEKTGKRRGAVERSIRYLVECVFDNLGVKEEEEYFGKCVNYKSGKLTNASFVAKMAECVRLKIGVYR